MPDTKNIDLSNYPRERQGEIRPKDNYLGMGFSNPNSKSPQTKNVRTTANDSTGYRFDGSTTYNREFQASPPRKNKYMPHGRAVNILTWDNPYRESPGRYRSRYDYKRYQPYDTNAASELNDDVTNMLRVPYRDRPHRYPQQYNDNYTNIFGNTVETVNEEKNRNSVTPDSLEKSLNNRRNRRYIMGNYNANNQETIEYSRI